ncbi:MAG: UDP-glucose 4-epimerase GalE [Deltaproteobacteria bacterium]|nr:UDP-glucose 4-epimerase GalE [Candidatus Zymogenaceae bacterium]
MTTILVVGGAGYIGSHAVKALMAAGFTPIVLDNLSRGHRDAVLCPDFIQADLTDRKVLDRVFGSVRIDAVMHFAALTYVGESVEDPGRYYTNNVVGCINLLSAMRKAEIDKILFSSSAAVYGNPREIPITEDHPRDPINPYGMTKYVMERAMEDFSAAYGLRFVSLRYFNAAGADPDGELGERHDPETHLIPAVLMAAGGISDEIVIFGDDYPTPDGTCVRDYVHITDLVDAHLLALEGLNAGGMGGCYNLGSEKGHSVNEVIETAKAVTGRPITVRVGPRRPGDPSTLIASSQKAKEELGWCPIHTDLVDMVGSAWRFMLRRGIVQ